MRIDELTVRQPVTASPGTTLQQAAHAMAAQGVGTLVITENDQVLGIVTDRDIVVRGLAQRVPTDARIDSIMTAHVIAVDGTEDVRNVVKTFGHHAVRRLPVVRARHLVGLVSLDDMFVALNDEMADLTRGITAQALFPHAGDEPPTPVPIMQDPPPAENRSRNDDTAGLDADHDA